MTFRDALLLILAYLLGSIPFGYVFTRLKTGRDIRDQGSGNIGATNVLRTQGKALGALTMLLDVGKAVLAVSLCKALGSNVSAGWLAAAGGAAAAVGHCYPFCLGFRGGKGIATGFGAFIVVAPAATLVSAGVFLLEMLTLRWVSLGSILASLSLGAAMGVCHLAFGWYTLPSALIAAGLSLLLVARHATNIRRLLAGTEPTLWGAGSGRDKEVKA